MHDKATITNLIMDQAYESLILAIEACKKNKISKEVQLSINIYLLLGIAMEGVINELGESLLDNWTYEELEKTTTPFKWKLISSLKQDGFTPDREPLQTIINLQKIRNEIAHPKSKKQDTDIIVSSKDTLEVNPKADYILPKEDLDVYIGFGKLHKKYNARKSFDDMKKAIVAVKLIKGLFGSTKIFPWVDSLENQLKQLKLD